MRSLKAKSPWPSSPASTASTPTPSSRGKNTLLEKGQNLFAGETQAVEYEKRIRELEQLIGEVEIALRKNFLGQGR